MQNNNLMENNYVKYYKSGGYTFKVKVQNLLIRIFPFY